MFVQNAPPVVARPRIVPSPAAQALEASLYEQSLADFADTAGYTWQLRMKNEKAMQDIDALRRMGKLAYPAKDPFDGPPSCRFVRQGVVNVLVFGNCDNSVHEKDMRFHKRGTQVTRARQGDLN